MNAEDPAGRRFDPVLTNGAPKLVDLRRPALHRRQRDDRHGRRRGNVGEATSLALPPSTTTAQTAVISYFARPDTAGGNSSITLAVIDYRVASP